MSGQDLVAAVYWDAWYKTNSLCFYGENNILVYSYTRLWWTVRFHIVGVPEDLKKINNCAYILKFTQKSP